MADVHVDKSQVRDAVAHLSEHHRTVIYRAYYLGRSTTQIAAELSSDENVVKDELHHALRALRITLQRASG